MTNEELLTAIGKGDADGSLLMELWNQNERMIGKACGKYSKRIEEEDARQECFFALVNAVNEYDPEKGATFANYLYRRCTWHLSRYAAESWQIIRLPEQRWQQIRKYLQFVRLWYQKTGSEPNQNVLRLYLGLTEEDTEQIKADMQVLNLRSLDEPLPGDPEDLQVGDVVMDPRADPEGDALESVFDRERRRAVWSAVEQLDPQQQDVIRLYYQYGLNYGQAGAVMGVSSERVRAIMAKAFRQMRTHKRFKELRSFVDLSPVYSMGIRGSAAAFNRTWTSATEKTALHLLEMEERWKREREELDRMYERNRKEREEYERRRKSGNQ